ncbi:uncharacterized protein LOC126687699 [Mercurialis annua]|uniref:uncharacterized protein LOC126687699 n=1 Tax=Mercurialis annua TaxID=3986 RepID=UPI00215F543C|nr:uncharacterized protein LOC126687699 [Mercurialis annua]
MDLKYDEEYIQARNDRVKFKNFKPQPEPMMNAIGRMPSLESSLPQDTNEAYEDTIEGYCSDYDDSEGDVHSITSSHEDFDVFDEGRSDWKKKKNTFYDPLCDAKDLQLRLGMQFEHAHQCRDAIVRWAILNGHNIKTVRSWKWQLEMKCVAECPWNLYGSIIQEEQNFVIKRYNGQHLCSRTMENRQATCTWIAKEYKDRFRRDPNWAPKHLELDLLEKFCLKVSKWKCYRAKWGALDMLRGSVFEHYACLRSYKAELMRVDREGRFDFLVGDNFAFKGFFIGFSGVIKGFRDGCRPVIGFDGCFLKTFLGGALLCAVAKDGNNQMFPICWAVVESENEYYWTWFLQILFEELGIVDGVGWSFMSDQQKGLINAIANLTPHAEHRNCARHVYCNWKKEFKGQTLKNMFWRVARSTYEAAAKINLDAMMEENGAAHADIIRRDLKKFCKLYMSTRPKSDMIDNNVCETFNGYIVKARAMHIIEMLEEIRCALMRRFHTKLTAMSGVTDSICPRIRQRLEVIRYTSRLCTSTPSKGDKFQVAIGEDQFIVDLNNGSCTCNLWQLSGIPCIHACSRIHWLKKDPADYVDEYFSVQRYIEAYKYGIEPINGKKMWHVAEGNSILPPEYKKMPGRPKQKRKEEPMKKLVIKINF